MTNEQQLVLDTLPLVYSILKSTYIGKIDVLDFEDVAQEMFLELCKLAKRYNQNHRNKCIYPPPFDVSPEKSSKSISPFFSNSTI